LELLGSNRGEFGGGGYCEVMMNDDNDDNDDDDDDFNDNLPNLPSIPKST
jgi:hypothetical protein